MSFINQPDEIIIERLRSLPLEELSNACQLSPEVSRICQGRRLWDLMLFDDFNTTRGFQDLRGYYFYLLGERQRILNLILTKVTPEFFTESNGLFDDPVLKTYSEFVDFQRSVVEGLTEKEIEEINFILIQPSDQVIQHYSEGGATPINTLFFYPLSTSADLSGSSYTFNTMSIY